MEYTLVGSARFELMGGVLSNRAYEDPALVAEEARPELHHDLGRKREWLM